MKMIEFMEERLCSTIAIEFSFDLNEFVDRLKIKTCQLTNRKFLISSTCEINLNETLKSILKNKNYKNHHLCEYLLEEIRLKLYILER